MTVLCSDKTGTLTTADMRVLPHRTWTNRMTKDDALLYACLASNPANKDAGKRGQPSACIVTVTISEPRNRSSAKSKNEFEIHYI